MAILSHAMQEQVWTFLRIYTPDTNLFLAQPLELRSPVPFPARGLGRMPVHHGKSMQRKLPSRRSKWLAAQPPYHPTGGPGSGARAAVGGAGTATAIPAHRSQSLGCPGRAALDARISWPLRRTSSLVFAFACNHKWVLV